MNESFEQLAAPWPGYRRGLYAVTPDIGLDGEQWLRRIDQALDGGIVLLQVRDKTAEPGFREHYAGRAVELCQAAGVPCLINDDPVLARRLGAQGVHVGQEDVGVREAAQRLGADAIIGASCYNSVVLGQQAAYAGASYLAFGAFFPSPTKPDARVASRRLIAPAKVFGLPVVAIGGITLDTAPELVEAGIDLLAVITDLFGAEDIRGRARAYARLWR